VVSGGCLVVLLSLIPVAGLFTTTRIFFVRDLSLFFWSRHLWLRHTLLGGSAPWWDPYVAAGQSAIADALNQVLMPVTVAIRLIPSEVVAFNLWVALPLPIAGLGTFCFLRRRVPAAAAAVGACAFALSGPVVSMLNAPNLSWSVALMPWVFAACEARRFVAVAVVFALQALCGEPLTWAATGVLVLAYGFFCRPVIAALAAGALLAAPQLVPTAMAGMRAQRAAAATPDFWSLHPLALWETVTPTLFGDYYYAFLADLPWMEALNFGRDPFFYSLYIGPVVVLLAVVGVRSRFRRSAFWACVAIVFVIGALGGYTPLYPLVRKLVPPLMYFRFPVKYIVFAVFACAVLAAEGWAAIANLPPKGGSHRKDGGSLAVIAVFGLLLSIAALVMPDLAMRAAQWLAVSTHLKDPAAGAAFLAGVAPRLLLRLFATLLVACVVLWYGRFRPSSFAPGLLFAALCIDLLVTNGGLNPTINAAKLTPPAWYLESAREQRLYVGGRVRGFMNTSDPDASGSWHIPAEATAIEGRMQLNAELPMAPSGFRVREALSYDLPHLWPSEYEAAVKQFERAGPDARHAFLRRGGVRRCVLPKTEPRQFRVVADVPAWNMRVFDCDPGATRVFLATDVAVSPAPADLGWQRDALFDTALADTVVRMPALPQRAGHAGVPEPPFLRIVEDGSTRVVIEAALPEAGVLVLRDSYDPSWIAEVDGEPAQIARANSLYRAVSLPEGRHVIRFSYRPRELRTGLIISMMTGAGLAFVAFRKTRTRNASGFTLIELMIVLVIVAVLLSIAFNEYRGMQARGNDASAIGSLRSIAAAQWQFALTCGNMKYATTLPALAQPVPATGQGFLSPDLTSAESFEKSGYQFQMAAKPLDGAPPACNGVTVAEGYAATADPVKPGLTGNYFYGVNADRILYLDQEKTFTGNLPESGPGGHGGEVR
jgi:prepilin-type N-terminal cleavage/methylation domain-containing protein